MEQYCYYFYYHLTELYITSIYIVFTNQTFKKYFTKIQPHWSLDVMAFSFSTAEISFLNSHEHHSRLRSQRPSEPLRLPFNSVSCLSLLPLATPVFCLPSPSSWNTAVLQSLPVAYEIKFTLNLVIQNLQKKDYPIIHFNQLSKIKLYMLQSRIF